MRTSKKFDRAVAAIRKHPKKKKRHVKTVAKEIGVSVHTLYNARKWLNKGGSKVVPSPRPGPGDTNIQKLVAGKGKEYGHPLDNFRRANAALDVIDECKDAEVRHALTMLWLKITRLVETPDHKDSIEDLKGYAETIHMIHAERKRRKK